MLEPILQGLIEWLYSLLEDIADYFFGDIIDVLTMDMDYFRKAAPIVDEISEVILALAWALLIGNLVFQAIKSMMSGVGFDGEDPRLLFLRTFVFSFLLLSSRQICDMCSQITGRVVALISIQQHFTLIIPTASMFLGAGSIKWLIAIIVGVFLIIQMIKLFFDIGERYVISCVLTFMAPLAFAMGASKNTSDIFKGWCRMYGSMNLMLIMNIIFLKLITSAMANVSSSNIVIWFIFVLALTRVARKIDAHIAKIGLNPAQTGNSVGLRIPGGLTMVVVRTIASLATKGASNMKGGSGGGNRSGGSHHHSHNNGGSSNNRNNSTNTNTAGRGQNPSPNGDTINVSVNNNPSRGNSSGGTVSGGRGDRNGRTGANTASRYGNNSQGRSGGNTDTGRDTNNRDNSRNNSGGSSSNNTRPTTSQPANTGSSHAENAHTGNSHNTTTATRGSDVRSATRTGTAYANRNTYTHDSAHTSYGDNSASSGRGGNSHSTSNPPPSRNTGSQSATSHASSSASSTSSSNTRPPRVNVNVSGEGMGNQNISGANAQNVQSPSRVSGSMADGGRFNADTSRSGPYSNIRASNSRGGNSSSTYNSEHSSTVNNSFNSSVNNNTNTSSRRNDPASANRRGGTTYYRRDTGSAGRNNGGGRHGKA